MEFVQRSILSASEKLAVFHLWNNEYPEKLAYDSMQEFDAYLSELRDPSHLLLVDSAGKVRGWYFDFIRDQEKWFAIILDAQLQGKGYGSQLLERAKQYEKELNGWVIDHNNDKKRNGEFYQSPLNFYLKNGFRKLKEDRLELNKISAVKIKWVKQAAASPDKQ